MCTKDKCCSEPGESKQRESGFYWVRDLGNWMIGEYEKSSWLLLGESGDFDDSDFEEIDERPIIRQTKEVNGGCGCDTDSEISIVQRLTNEVVEAEFMPKITDIQGKIKAAALRGEDRIYLDASRDNYRIASYFKRMGYGSDQASGIYIYISW